MEVSIDKNKKISTIQHEFQKRFPYLKIEFYKVPHKPNEGSLKENMLDSDLTIGEVHKDDSSGIININGLMTVAELEAAFKDVYGLFVQVFRKSGTVWLQTIRTDNWTLAEQNHKASEKHEIVDKIIDAKDRMELE